MRIKAITLLAIVTLSSISCSKEKGKKEDISVEKNTSATIINKNSKGYKLMEQKCFICHQATPNSANKATMIAPPMQKVQEHYKPMYASKEAFVAAISQWVQNPNEANTLMPGAVRKFKVMPKMAFEAEDIKLIAETLYAVDFGKTKEMKTNSLQLNKGKKWKLNADTTAKINSISNQLANFESSSVSAYNKLGTEVLNSAKEIILDNTYKGLIFEQLHSFFNNIEGNMHQLIGAKTIDLAKQQQAILKTKFTKFYNFFE